MKMRLLCVALFSLGLNVSAEEKEAKVLREMRAAGYIVVIDSAEKPVEIQKESEGGTIVCYSLKHKDSQYFTVRKEMFERGQFSILIACTEGELSVKPGYI